MKQPEAIEYLEFMLQIKNKQAFIEAKTKSELEQHPIINIWRNKNFIEKFAEEIVNKLNDDVNL